MIRKYIFFCAILMLNCSEKPATKNQNLKVSEPIKKAEIQSLNSEDFVEIDFKKVAIINKMAYATDSNFLHQKVYPCARAFVRKEVYSAFIKASEIAKTRGYSLIIYDAYRPISIQRKMYELVNNPNYVAHPDKGSKHNRGCAVDVGLWKANQIVDMGTVFDDFSEKANYHSKSISKSAQENRKILREIMTQAGFVPYDKEWWHFNYKKTDYPISDFVWTCGD